MTTSPVTSDPARVTPLPRALGWSARVAQGVLALWAVFVPLALGVLLEQRDLLQRVHRHSSSLRFDDLVASDAQVRAVNRVSFGLLAVSVIAWMVWWVCAYRAASDRRAQRYGRGWAFGGWCVPFAALVVPKRVADDLWTAAREPDWPKDERARSSWTIVAWWTAWLLAGFLAVFAARPDEGSVDSLLTVNAVYVVRCVVILVAAMLAIRFIALVTEGFVAPAPSAPPLDARASDRRRRRVRLVVVAVAGLGLVATLTAVSRAAFDIGPHRTVAVATADGRRVAPAGAHFSIVVPNGWIRPSPHELPAGVVFAAARVGDGGSFSGVSVAEGPAGGATASGAMQATITSQFDVAGPVTQTSVSLPAGEAECFTFSATVQHAPVDARIYVLRGDAYDHVIAVVAARDLPDADRRGLDRMVRSFRVASGVGV